MAAFLWFVSSACGCAATPAATTDSGADGASNQDGGAVPDDAGTDAAVEPPDAPPGVDAAPPLCNGAEGPMPMGLCDGRGMTGCRLWAEANANAPGMAYAICIQMGTGGCARADACTDARVPSTCTCGLGPACDPLEVCAADATGGPPHCRCITPAP